MTEAVQNYIGSLNWGYRVSLRENKVTYENAYGEFVGPHKIKVMEIAAFILLFLGKVGWSASNEEIPLDLAASPEHLASSNISHPPLP